MGNPPSRSTLASTYMRKQLDSFARAKSWDQRLRMLWLTRLDRVYPAGWANVFIWRKAGLAGWVTLIAEPTFLFLMQTVRQVL